MRHEEIKSAKMLKAILIGAAIAISFRFNMIYGDLWDIENALFEFNERSRKNSTVSLKQFSILKPLGSGLHSTVYLARKSGGSDEGHLYALKVVNIPYTLDREEIIRRRDKKDIDLLNNERQILETVKGMASATELHYAFVERHWAFLVMDFGIGGSLESRLEASMPDTITAKLILAEIVSSIEQFHKANILHADLHPGNFLLDAKGHLLLTDFGCARPIVNDDATNLDWNRIYYMCFQIFAKPKREEKEISLIRMLKSMTTRQLPELKNHTYFHGIDWDMVAKRKFVAPFEPTVFKMDLEIPMDPASLFNITTDGDVKQTTAERLNYYSFVANEHQN